MDLIVVDTDVVSFYFKQDPCAQPYVAQWTGKTLVVSFMTVAELRLWAILREWGPKRVEQMRSLLSQQFVVHPVDDRLCPLLPAMVLMAGVMAGVLVVEIQGEATER